MELYASVIGFCFAWTILGIFPRRVVRFSWKIPRDLFILSVFSILLSGLCADILGVPILAYLAICLYQELPSPWLSINGKAVVITGCDQGIGHALALHLDKLGFKVFAGCLDQTGHGATELVRQASGRLVTLQMDITDRQQVKRAAEKVREELKGDALYGLVNNAGVLFLGNVELMSDLDIDKILKVNVRGLIAVYRAFMPLLRMNIISGDGARLINVGSNIGLAPASQMGVYGASKAAVSLLSDTWRMELRPLGIKVSTIVPSGFRTGIILYDREAVGNKWWKAAEPEVKEYFGKECFIVTNKRPDYKSYLSSDFSPMVKCAVDALLSSHPKAFYYKGFMSRSVPFLYCHCPEWLWDIAASLVADYFKFPVRVLSEKEKKGK